MKISLRDIVLVSIFVLSTHQTKSYVRFQTTGNGIPIAWNFTNPDTPIVSNGRIVYSLNPAGSDNLPFSEVGRVIATSFQTWENIPTSTIAFARGPDNPSTGAQNDGVFQIYWLENTTVTPEGLNIAGALAVTLLRVYDSGPRAGEITDVSTVFNGNQFTWTTDGRADTPDLEEVATHEFGHVIGLSHSPIGGTTMFPRTGFGRIQGRTLATDDIIGASVIYPASGFNSSTGTLAGRVSDNNGTGIFGAHIVVSDAKSVVTSGTLSQPDGSYSIRGLSPGSYSVYAEPLDPFDPNGGTYFSRGDLSNYFGSLNTDFLMSGDFPAGIAAGSNTTLNITVTRANPAFNVNLVSDPSGRTFSNAPTFISQGQNNVTVGVAGPGLPQLGTPLSISGPGITILRTYFGTVTPFPAILVDINVSATAPPGPRNIIITSGSQRTAVTGGVEIVGPGGTPSTVSTVSAANFGNQVAAESIVAAFGTNLATTSASASSIPLPTALEGTSVRLRDSAGNERPAPLFFVSPTQVNYQIAPGITIGQTSVTVTGASGVTATGSILVNPVAPGLFSADSTGSGIAAANVLRVRSNGSQVSEPVVRFDAATNRFVAVPIDLGPDLGNATDQVFLVLYGTGVRFRSTLPSVTIGGVNSQVTFAGAQGTFVGLDQINVRLDRGLIGRGLVNIVMTVDGRTANSLSVNMK